MSHTYKKELLVDISMVKIEEVQIPRKKEPIFIDYSKIYGDAKKKLIFLRALIQIINTRADFIKFEELGLTIEDTKLFTEYLKKYYSKNFDPKKNRINLYENYDGKIICNIDLLMDDLFKVLLQNPSEESPHYSLQNPDQRSKSVNVDPNSKCDPVEPKGSKSSSNTYLEEILHFRVSLAESQLFVDKIFRETNMGRIESLFTFNILCEEIDQIPLRVKKKEIDYESLILIRRILERILKKIGVKLNNPLYWNNLAQKVDEYFLKKLDQCSQELLEILSENGTRILVTLNELILNENIKIFLAEQGNPAKNSRNAVISKYYNKIALFNSHCELSRAIRLNDIVLAEIAEIAEKYVKVNPLKILTKSEAVKLISLDVECELSNEKIISTLSEGTV